MSFIKGLIPGLLLTWIVSTLIGSQGAKGAWAMIHRANFEGIQFYWSWPLCVAFVGLAWLIFYFIDS
ncbi:MAG: hypothetical protein KDE55_01840 [Novosphingobium sp.]|nr:hypothetical protein [Erythrobacter sp.]MCB2076418.1 hypothetical protein [Novosphingobium sp.]